MSICKVSRLSVVFVIVFGMLFIGTNGQLQEYTCPAGVDCVGLQVIGGAKLPLNCSLGYYCPDGHTIKLCKEGYYCPTPMEQLPCPKDKWCPSGFSEPIDCFPGSLCPEKSFKMRWLLPILFYSLIFVAAAIARVIFLRIERRKAQELSQTTAVQDTSFMFEKQGEMKKLELDCHDMEVKVEVDSGSKTVLHKVTAKFESGRICAIMGPSGSGKTTMLNALSGRVRLSSGVAVVRGKDIGEASLVDIRNQIGFVPQEDVLLPMLTVRDTLLHSARMRLPDSMSDAEKCEQVERVIGILGLAHVANSQIGDELTRGISGGERKRVNIGMELVSNPILLLLDEPTSGLDATSALSVMESLKRISNKGILVASVIHQPRIEVYELFDDVLFLSPGGYMAYYGPTKNTADYFASIGFPTPPYRNPADFFLDVISGVEKKGEKEIIQENVAAAEQEPQMASFPSSMNVAAGLIAPQPRPRRRSSVLSKLSVPPVEVSFKEVVASVTINKEKKTIVSGVSGVLRPGKLTAIMGPSGAGKTSLVSVLMGRKAVDSGSVLFNNEKINADQCGKIVGFVPQDDVMIRSLTVREILLHSANMRLPVNLDLEEKKKRVELLITALNLEKVADNPIGDENTRGLSGGERKRVNVGIEIIASTSVLFLDEPTTGLDATASAELIQLLKDIAELSRITICAIVHQPRNEVFAMFDDLILLLPGGGQAYFGPVAQARHYFETIGYPCEVRMNPADWYLDVVSGSHDPVAAAAVNEEKKKEEEKDIQIKVEENIKLDEDARSPEVELVTLSPAVKEAKMAKRKKKAIRIANINSKWNAVSSTKLQEFVAQDEDKNLKGIPAPATRPGFFRQIAYGTYRSVLQYYRSIPTFLLEVEMHVLAGIVIGLAFADRNYFIPPLSQEYVEYSPEPLQSVLRDVPLRTTVQLLATFTVMAVGIVAAVLGVRSFQTEISNHFREAGVGASTLAYMIGKWLADIPFLVFYSLVYTLTFYLVASPSSKFSDFYGSIFVYEVCCVGIGYVCACWLENRENVLLLAAISSLLPGLAVDFRSVQNYICWSSWFGETVYISELRLDLLTPENEVLTRDWAKRIFKLDLDMYSRDILVVLLFGLVLRLISYFFLRRRTNKQLSG